MNTKVMFTLMFVLIFVLITSIVVVFVTKPWCPKTRYQMRALDSECSNKVVNKSMKDCDISGNDTSSKQQCCTDIADSMNCHGAYADCHEIKWKKPGSNKVKVPNGYEFMNECGLKGQGKIEPDCGNTIRKCCKGHCEGSSDCISKCTSETSNHCVNLCSSDTECSAGFSCINRQCARSGGGGGGGGDGGDDKHDDDGGDDEHNDDGGDDEHDDDGGDDDGGDDDGGDDETSTVKIIGGSVAILLIVGGMSFAIYTVIKRRNRYS
jgi:hypothetical protein